MNTADEGFLRDAVRLAAEAVAAGELPYGSLLVDAAGRVLAREHNTVRGERDISAHPELKLARWAAARFAPEQCGELTLYTSCEPCVMCANAIARAGVGRVAFALSTAQLHALQPPGLPRPDGTPVRYDGPALHELAREPIVAFYLTRG